MATERIPCGGWYVDDITLTFDENKVLSVVGAVLMMIIFLLTAV